MSPDLYMRCPSSSSSTDGARELCYRKGRVTRQHSGQVGKVVVPCQHMDGQQDMVSKGTARVDDRQECVVPKVGQSVWRQYNGRMDAAQ